MTWRRCANQSRRNVPRRESGCPRFRPEDRFDVLLDVLRPCLRKAWIPRAAANRMHLVAEELRLRAEQQATLFDLEPEKAAAVATLKKSVNDAIGLFSLRSRATLPLRSIYADAANGYVRRPGEDVLLA